MKIELTSEEREELLRMLEYYLTDMRVEIRHTNNRDYNKMLHREEDMLRGLIAKLREGVPENAHVAG